MAEIYGTFGPSCCSQNVLEAMLREGLTGMRLNLSHASLLDSLPFIDNYKKACEKVKKPMELMIDLHGPEQRIGQLAKELTLSPGDTLVLSGPDNSKAPGTLVVPAAILTACEPGDRLIIHDGAVELEAVERLNPAGSEKNPQRFCCRVLRGDTISGQQSIQIEGKEVYGDVVTQADLENLNLAKEMGVTSVMQPFVRGAEDLRTLRSVLEKRKLKLRIFAKIESLTGLANLETIIPFADVIVIARGDLGNAMPLWELPRAQKKIARSCQEAGKPFLTVTQLLASMTQNASPTRAEVSDIFNAILDGASAVMVTGETAVGRYPVEVIRYLAKTVETAEDYAADLSQGTYRTE